jgi:predicted transcriptional regulator
MRVEEIMTSPVVTVGFDDTLATVKEIFDAVKFHHLLVVEDGERQGVVSDRRFAEKDGWGSRRRPCRYELRVRSFNWRESGCLSRARQ